MTKRKTGLCSGESQNQRLTSAGKPYWEMNVEELAAATAEFDREGVGGTFGEPTPDQKARHARAKRKRGRPRIGKGTKVISVSVEKGLLARADRLAKRLRVKRAELVARGLQAVVNAEVPLAMVAPSHTGCERQ